MSDDEAPASESASAAPGPRKLGAPVDPTVAAELRAIAADRRVGDRYVARFGQATDALERNRLDEARRLIKPLVDNAPGVAAVQQLAGLIHYQLGRWRVTVGHLESARTLITDGSDLEFVPVLADAYRALRRWKEVDRLWSEVREISPAPAILAETRIVAAGAAADRDDLNGAIATMGKVSPRPKKVREHHVRQWYVLGDLHDRAGNTIEARRWFERAVAHDPAFADAADRLRALGR